MRKLKLSNKTSDYTPKEAEVEYLTIYITYPELTATKGEIGERRSWIKDFTDRVTRSGISQDGYIKLFSILDLINRLRLIRRDNQIGKSSGKVTGFVYPEKYNNPIGINFEKELLKIKRN